METLSVTSKKPFSMKLIESILAKDSHVEATSNGLVVHGTRSRAYLELDTELKDSKEYRLLIDYSEIELLKNLLEKIANDSSFTVDNDFGTILPGDAFLAKCKANSNWDWRQRF